GLRDRPRGEGLAQTGLDSGAEAPRLATATGGDQLGDGDRAVANGLGRPPVGTDRVRIGDPELQHGPEGVEPVGDLGVVHYGSMVPGRAPLRAGSAEIFDDLDQLSGSVSASAGEGHELAHAGGERAAVGGAGHGDATAATEL